MFCTKCGNQVAENGAFCKFYGNKLNLAEGVQKDTMFHIAGDLSSPPQKREMQKPATGS